MPTRGDSTTTVTFNVGPLWLSTGRISLCSWLRQAQNTRATGLADVLRKLFPSGVRALGTFERFFRIVAIEFP